MSTHTNHHEETPQSSKLEERVIFFLVAMGVITLTFGFFVLIDFLPEQKTAEEHATTTPQAEVVHEVQAETYTTAQAFPVTIIFDALKKEVKVENPTSNTIQDLDAALLTGAVRHPDSADFAKQGTMLILGHSSYIPTLGESYKTFNDIQKLEWGDMIRLQSSDTEYVYSVDKVYQAKASEADIPLQFDTPKLVLATCNSFGAKDDRFIVEASLVIKRPIDK